MVFVDWLKLHYATFLSRVSLTIIFIASSIQLNSQESSANIQISLLTYLPGNELYSIFGHSAIRVHYADSTFDNVYNFGTFDFTTENFYLKFVRGKLKYRLAKTDFDYVLNQVFLENRTLLESALELKDQEKIKLINDLEYLYLPENREYFYDFFYDNCATRIYHILDTVSDNRILPDALKEETKTFRNLVRSYLPSMPWTHLGINILMGISADKKASVKETSFLPLYLLNIMIESSRSDGRDMLSNHTIEKYQSIPVPSLKKHIRSELVFTLLLIIITLIKVLEHNRIRSYYLFDYIILVPLGILGILILLLWFLTDHYIYNWNYNLLWANPLYFLLLPGIIKNTRKIRVILISFLFLGLILQIIYIREIAILEIILIVMLRIWPLEVELKKTF